MLIFYFNHMKLVPFVVCYNFHIMLYKFGVAFLFEKLMMNLSQKSMVLVQAGEQIFENHSFTVIMFVKGFYYQVEVCFFYCAVSSELAGCTFTSKYSIIIQALTEVCGYDKLFNIIQTLLR
eukprot:TRINITY_DN1315_c0_g1_i1.p4 TRINITY_DN1315_c0_g1~~TRINITY_DN1315_c0_g1_i1.p4  ORF type:complete len:121 (-),score=2.00 TRINITY_DN1315_c0_g1_i1:659-1021(-)